MNLQDYLYNLGLDLYYGRNGEIRNLSKAAESFLEAAELGHPYATAYYAHMLYCNEIKSEDDWYIWEQKAAEMGCKFAEAFILEQEAEGQFGLDDLMSGDPIAPAIRARITQLMKEDADNGFLLSICRLAWDCLTAGLYKEAAKWYLKAAAQGELVGYKVLGLLYYYGQGIEKSYEKAEECFTNYVKVIYESERADFPLSIFEKRRYPSIEVCFFLAELGSSGAQSDAGYYYYIGKGREQSYEKAAEWFSKAAENGNANGQNNYGVCYQYGHGVEQSYEKAVEWYTKAAAQDNAQALWNLSYCCYHGLGTKKDVKRAGRLCLKANIISQEEWRKYFADKYSE